MAYYPSLLDIIKSSLLRNLIATDRSSADLAKKIPRPGFTPTFDSGELITTLFPFTFTTKYSLQQQRDLLTTYKHSKWTPLIIDFYTRYRHLISITKPRSKHLIAAIRYIPDHALLSAVSLFWQLFNQRYFFPSKSASRRGLRELKELVLNVHPYNTTKSKNHPDIMIVKIINIIAVHIAVRYVAACIPEVELFHSSPAAISFYSESARRVKELLTDFGIKYTLKHGRAKITMNQEIGFVPPSVVESVDYEEVPLIAEKQVICKYCQHMVEWFSLDIEMYPCDNMTPLTKFGSSVRSMTELTVNDACFRAYGAVCELVDPASIKPSIKNASLDMFEVWNMVV